MKTYIIAALAASLAVYANVGCDDTGGLLTVTSDAGTCSPGTATVCLCEGVELGSVACHGTTVMPCSCSAEADAGLTVQCIGDGCAVTAIVTTCGADGAQSPNACAPLAGTSESIWCCDAPAPAPSTTCPSDGTTPSWLVGANIADTDKCMCELSPAHNDECVSLLGADYAIAEQCTVNGGQASNVPSYCAPILAASGGPSPIWCCTPDTIRDGGAP